jgi:urea transport system substrate-binding protein
MKPDTTQADLSLKKPGDSSPTMDHSHTVILSQDVTVDPLRPRDSNCSADAWVGKSLGKYQITGVLGQGAMGVVFKAHDPLIDRDVAIKMLAGHLAADTHARDRFLSEAKAAGKLNHPNVITIHEIGNDEQTHYLVLEYVTGGSLNDRMVATGGLSVLEATQALIDACKGVSAAHAAGLIHRDIKPANFMRAADGSVKVADFGLAKAASGTGQGLTQAGMLVGTPFFMSPEQCEGKPLDPRTDLYSLGATYYSLLTGSHPFQGTDSIPQLMYLHCHGPIPDPRAVNPAIPEACSRIINRAMAKVPAERYQSAGEMLADLQSVVATLSGQIPIALPSDSRIFSTPQASSSGLSTVGPRRVLWVVAGLFLLGLVAIAASFWRPWEKSPERSDSALAVVPPVVPLGGEPVKIGVLHSMSGTMANSEAVVVDAVLFAIDEVNRDGGVLGRAVKPVVADGRSDWPTFAREAERLILQDKVCTVFGCWTSASRKTVKPIFESHDHLLVYPLQFEGLETSPSIIYMGAAPNQQILPALQWAMRSLNKKRFFLVGSDYVFPRAANAIIKDQLQSAGMEVVGEEYVLLGSQKLEAIVDAITNAKPDMILNTTNGDSNTAFFRALRAAGVTPTTIPTLSFSVGEQELRSLNLAELEGDYAAWTYFQSVTGAHNEDFVRRFHEKYPQRSISDPMETAYVGVKLWAQAVNEAQSLDPKKIRRAMLNQRMQGPGGEVRVDPDTQYCYRTPRIGQIQADGQFKVVWTAPEPLPPEPYPNSRTAEVWRAFLNDLYNSWGGRWAATEVDVIKETSPNI